MEKNIDNLIRDIYRLLEDHEIAEGVDLDAECDAFGRGMADVLREQLTTQYDGRGRLRLSAIGKPDRKLHYGYKGVSGEDLRGSTYIKFLYGHLVEAMLLALVRISGHSVTDEQKEVEVGGVTGHIDGYIDGVLMDVKSCSSYGFKKFQRGTLHEDDEEVNCQIILRHTEPKRMRKLYQEIIESEQVEPSAWSSVSLLKI